MTVKPHAKPYAPADLEYHEVMAIKALNTGTANERQQEIALKFIVAKLGMLNDMEFRPDERETAFAGGRRWVALQICKAINYSNPEELKGKNDE